MNRLILHAPGIHVGGGLVLLKEIISVNNVVNIILNLDTRAIKHIEVPAGTDVYSIPYSITGRIKADMYLKNISKKDDIILCFHGLPPLFSVKGKVVVYIQNRHTHINCSPAQAGTGFYSCGAVRVLGTLLQPNSTYTWLIRK